MFIGIHFLKMFGFINFFFSSNLIHRYFHQGLKSLEIQKMIYLHFLLNFSKIEIFCLLVCVDINLKMDNLYSFKKVL